MNQSACWDVETTARFLRCNKATVYRLLRKQKLPGIKIGRDWRIDARKVQAMFA